ncbi:MAG TPA: SWIM zinc finger family protein [Rhizomicrobium sp.]
MKNRPRFDTDTLRELAGERTFARGEACLREGQVSIVSFESQRVLAQIAGPEDYRCVLTGRGKKLEGECSCPTFEARSVCKHVIAVALAANAADPAEEIDTDTVQRRIRRYLREKNTDDLVDLVLDAAEKDMSLFHRLNLVATAAYGDEGSIGAQLRNAIDGATKERDITNREDARRWVASVKAALDNLAELTKGPRAQHALELADRALARILRVKEKPGYAPDIFDDLLKQASSIRVSAILATRPNPLELARDLFVREIENPDEIFAGAAAAYADALTEDGLGEYKRLAAEAWAKLPALGRHAQAEAPERYSRLLHILDFFAERAGDLETRIALRAKDMSTPSRYLELAEFCLEQGRREEALRRAEEGLWMFEDNPDVRLVLFVADRLKRVRRLNDAESCLWQTFEKRPGIEIYDALCSVSGAEAFHRTVQFLQSRLGTSHHSEGDEFSELLIEVLTREEKFDEAWKIADEYGASPETLDRLAQRTEATHSREALKFYSTRIEQLAETGNLTAYKELSSLLDRMALLQGPDGHASYIADLKSRFVRKRSLLRHLP